MSQLPARVFHVVHLRSSSPKNTMSRPQRRWTADEDSSLQREVEAQMAGTGAVLRSIVTQC